jgi:hypothetical protein
MCSSVVLELVIPCACSRMRDGKDVWRLLEHENVDRINSHSMLVRNTSTYALEGNPVMENKFFFKKRKTKGSTDR